MREWLSNWFSEIQLKIRNDKRAHATHDPKRHNHTTVWLIVVDEANRAWKEKHERVFPEDFHTHTSGLVRIERNKNAEYFKIAAHDEWMRSKPILTIWYSIFARQPLYDTFFSVASLLWHVYARLVSFSWETWAKFSETIGAFSQKMCTHSTPLVLGTCRRRIWIRNMLNSLEVFQTAEVTRNAEKWEFIR